MKQVLVLGAGGMAGHVIAIFLSENGYGVTTLSAHRRLNDDTALVDATDSKAFTEYLSTHKFDVIVNCIGMLVKPSEERRDLASYLNAYLPHQLEELYRKSKTRIVHLSTDCVFSGRTGRYSEDAWPDGMAFYDRSKALGEINNDKDLTFRMSIVGPELREKGTGLFNWFYSQSGRINGYRKAIWNGVTTMEVARAIDEAVKQDLTGLYHLVPEGNISKYNLLLLFKTVFEREDILVQPVDDISLDKTLVNTRKDFRFSIKEYPSQVLAMRKWIEDHKALYPHYGRE